MQITWREYIDAANLESGYCVLCKKFTRPGINIRAEEEQCPLCNEDTVYGVEIAQEIGGFDLDPTTVPSYW